MARRKAAKNKFKIGDRVKYVNNEDGDDEENPLWGGQYGYIAGTIEGVELGGHIKSFFTVLKMLMQKLMPIKSLKIISKILNHINI